MEQYDSGALAIHLKFILIYLEDKNELLLLSSCCYAEVQRHFSSKYSIWFEVNSAKM